MKEVDSVLGGCGLLCSLALAFILFMGGLWPLSILIVLGVLVWPALSRPAAAATERQMAETGQGGGGCGLLALAVLIGAVIVLVVFGTLADVASDPVTGSQEHIQQTVDQNCWALHLDRIGADCNAQASR